MALYNFLLILKQITKDLIVLIYHSSFSKQQNKKKQHLFPEGSQGEISFQVGLQFDVKIERLNTISIGY